MLRKFTKDVGRFRVGGEYDYPRDVWNQIARDSGMRLDAFSDPLEGNLNQIRQSVLKGRRPMLHKRHGATM